MKKKWKKIIIVIIIIVLLIIFSMILTNNIRIFTKMKKAAQQNGNLSNYSYTMNTINLKNGDKSVSKYWVKDGAFTAKINGESSEGITYEAAVHEDKDNEIYLLKRSDGSVYYSINGESNSKLTMKCVPINFAENYNFESNIWNIKYITEEEFIGKNCYFMQTKANDKYWIEKDTGFIIGWTLGDSIMTVSYEVGNVTDEDVKIPDSTKYKK